MLEASETNLNSASYDNSEFLFRQLDAVYLNFNIRDVEFSLYSFNLFKVTSSSNDAISTAFIAISNSYDEISTGIV